MTEFPPRFDRDEVLAAYLAALVWTGRIDWMTATEEFGGEPLQSDALLDRYLSVDDLDPEIVEHSREDVNAFLDQVEPGLEDYPRANELTAAGMGHDFCLTRNRHGAGFWDRGLGHLGEYLTEACKGYGDHDLHGQVLLKDPKAPYAAVLDDDNVRKETLVVWENR